MAWLSSESLAMSMAGGLGRGHLQLREQRQGEVLSSCMLVNCESSCSFAFFYHFNIIF